jgi:hypothetical protein
VELLSSMQQDGTKHKQHSTIGLVRLSFKDVLKEVKFDNDFIYGKSKIDH